MHITGAPMKKSKKFRVAAEGVTVDGRSLSRQQIQEMASDYNKDVYTAGINIEHLRSAYPNSLFRNYGVVDKLSAEEITTGPLAGKLALNAEIEVEDSLVNLFSSAQKLYPSIEYHPNLSGSGKAYCLGLGFTDTPASLGTQIVKFSATQTENLFAVGEQVSVEFSTPEQQNGDDKPGLLARIGEMFSSSKKHGDERLSGIEQAIELMAGKLVEVTEKLNAQLQPEKLNEQNSANNSASETEALRAEVTQLKEKLSALDGSNTHRFTATGGGAEIKTDC
ncbi:GPO family capsid scaffolding protein [Salmonella enterica subsp. enterica serovar Muenchen]|nr:GPO family capsid scaffolding protein [Salmonella enterica]EBK2763482.1 GPO family capsid scaffolding protein [Salmonella enterica subsp. enterica serovar Muenchen]PVP21398.1 capsid protein [Salmonella enterica subsp. enterica serovar Braenderup]